MSLRKKSKSSTSSHTAGTQSSSSRSDDFIESSLTPQDTSESFNDSREKSQKQSSSDNTKSTQHDEVESSLQARESHNKLSNVPELNIAQGGDRSMSSLSSSQYHAESRMIVVESGSRETGNSRSNNLSDLSSCASSSNGSNSAKGRIHSKVCGKQKEQGENSCEISSFERAARSKHTQDKDQDASEDSGQQSSVEFRGYQKMDSTSNFMIQDKSLFWFNDENKRNPPSSCSDDGYISESALGNADHKLSADDSIYTQSEDSFILDSVSSSQQAVCPCMCALRGDEDVRLRRAWMNLLERKPKHADKDAMKSWLLQVMQTARQPPQPTPSENNSSESDNN